MGGMGLSVDRILNSIDRKDMDDWIAFNEIEPDLMETLIGVVKLGFSTLMTAWGGEFTPDAFDPRKQKKDNEITTDPSPDQQVALVKAHSK